MSRITTNLAKKLIKNYEVHKIGEKIEPTETRGVWFSRETILDALDPVHGIYPNGLRFYFAAYETNEGGTRPPLIEEYQNKTTLVIIPTTHRLDERGNVIMSPYNKKEILPYDLLEDPEALPEYDKLLNKQHNDGQLCPPPNVIS